MSTLMLYSCGGAGINLTLPLLRFNGKKEEGFAEMQITFIDTSRSNLRNPDIPENCVYLVEGLDGSGKKRDANHRVIAERTKEILHKHKPCDINVVVHSASGGSGSVLGPTLVSELLARGESVIVVLVGSSDSRIEANNTANTLRSYEVISEKRNMPVISVYYENSKASPRGTVDKNIHTAMVLIAGIYSGENHELDSADLKNFLNYPAVTSFSPKLTHLEFFSKEVEVGKNHTVVGLVTLTDGQTDSVPNIPVEYQAVGYVGDKAKAAISVELPIHAATVVGYYHDAIDRLTATIKNIDELRNTIVDKRIVSGNVSSTDEGLVL